MRFTLHIGSGIRQAHNKIQAYPITQPFQHGALFISTLVAVVSAMKPFGLLFGLEHLQLHPGVSHRDSSGLSFIPMFLCLA